MQYLVFFRLTVLALKNGLLELNLHINSTKIIFIYRMIFSTVFKENCCLPGSRYLAAACFHHNRWNKCHHFSHTQRKDILFLSMLETLSINKDDRN